jgi:hypothetical protein
MVEGLAAWPSKGGEMAGGLPYGYLEVWVKFKIPLIFCHDKTLALDVLQVKLKCIF